jgi:membrane protein
MLATVGFAWYARNVTNYSLVYGSLGTSMALLVWMYLLAAIALFGCEFNAELERIEHSSNAG